MTSRLVSPNDIHNAAKEHVLEGCDPITAHDWQLVVNFWAANIMTGLESSACMLLAKIYDCPLPEEDVEAIVKFQASKKKEG